MIGCAGTPDTKYMLAYKFDPHLERVISAPPEYNRLMKSALKSLCTISVGVVSLVLVGCHTNDVRVSTTELVMCKQTVSGPFDVDLTPQSDAPGIGHPSVGRMSIDKHFHGELEAHSLGQMLGVRSVEAGSGGYVAMERVEGTLAGRTGSFVLQHSSIMNRGTPTQAIMVVPDSGTDQLVGLAGEMTIDIIDGKHFYHFDYWFEPEAQD